MASERSVKEFSFVSYLLFSHYSCDRCTSSPFRRLQFKRPNAPTLPIAPQGILLFSFQIVYSLRRRVIYTGRRGLGWWWGCTYGGGGGLHDVDGYGWHGEMMMLALHLVVDFHFMIWIISLATVSLFWSGSSANFPPTCTKAYLIVLDGCWISCIKLSSSEVDEDRLFMELMQISKASDLLSWRWIFLVAVFFAVIFLASSTALLFTATCLHWATLAALRYIPN